jgi:hypothetical protein
VSTGRHVPITHVDDNDDMPYVRPLDPALGTVGTMLREHGSSCTSQGKWHLSNAALDPSNPVSTVDEVRNLAHDDAHAELVTTCSAKLEAIIDDEIDDDTDT